MSFVFTEENLANGEILEYMLSEFKKDPNKENLYKTLALIRSSKVWIPCKLSLSDRDQARIQNRVDYIVENMGAVAVPKFENKDGMKAIPEIIKNGGDCFYPIFTSEKLMSKYDTGYVKVQRPILEIIDLAKRSKVDLKGLVLNPYSDMFIITKELYPSLAQMESLIKD